jgi:hypothetical protein
MAATVRVVEVLALSLSVIACGGGSRDFEVEIVDGYFFSDGGGDSRSIYLKSGGSLGPVGVDSRVDQYRVVDSRILVTRRPRVTFQSVIGGVTVTDSRLAEVCEYWVIDTISDTVSPTARTEEWGDLKCFGVFGAAED